MREERKRIFTTFTEAIAKIETMQFWEFNMSDKLWPGKRNEILYEIHKRFPGRVYGTTSSNRILKLFDGDIIDDGTILKNNFRIYLKEFI